MSIDSENKLIDTKSIKNETIIDATYSIRAYPKGCSLSAGFADILKVISDTTCEPASERLFTDEMMVEGTKLLKELYDEWTKRLNQIKEVQIPKLSDLILDAEYSLSQMDYKSTMYKIAKLEMELYKVRTNSDFLFGEIKDLTSSEERSRTIITGYKARYRTLFEKFNEIIHVLKSAFRRNFLHRFCGEL